MRFLDALTLRGAGLPFVFPFPCGFEGVGLGDGGWDDAEESEVMSTEGDRPRFVEGGGLADIVSGSGGGGNMK